MGSESCRISSWRSDAHAPSFHLQPALRKKADRFRIRDFLFLKHPAGERMNRVIVQHPTGSLNDDRPGVVMRIDKMNGAPADPAAMIQHRLVHLRAVHPLSAEAGEQRWMD